MQSFINYIAIERRYSPRTVEAYEANLKAFADYLRTHYGDPSLSPRQATESDVKDWMMQLIEKKKMSPRSIRQHLTTLHSYFRFLLRTGAVSKDVTRRVVAPKVDKPLPVFFKPQEMQRVTAYDDQADDFESLRDCLIIEMLYQTGMRQAEMLNLTDADIDLPAANIRIFGKRRKERVVPIGDKLMDLIRRYRDVRPDNSPFGTFFVRQKKNGDVLPMTKPLLYCIVRTRMGEVSTLKKHSPHVLRHTFATTMLDNGADIRTIKDLMGHASIAATQVYTHTTFDQIRRSYEAAHPRAKTNG
jgi:integrase/recombinase XerC